MSSIVGRVGQRPAHAHGGAPARPGTDRDHEPARRPPARPAARSGCALGWLLRALDRPGSRRRSLGWVPGAPGSLVGRAIRSCPRPEEPRVPRSRPGRSGLPRASRQLARAPLRRRGAAPGDPGRRPAPRWPRSLALVWANSPWAASYDRSGTTASDRPPCTWTSPSPTGPATGCWPSSSSSPGSSSSASWSLGSLRRPAEAAAARGRRGSAGHGRPGADLPRRHASDTRRRARAGPSRRRPTSPSPRRARRRRAPRCRRPCGPSCSPSPSSTTSVAIVIIAVAYSRDVEPLAAGRRSGRAGRLRRRCSACASTAGGRCCRSRVLAWVLMHAAGVHADRRRGRARPADPGARADPGEDDRAPSSASSTSWRPLSAGRRGARCSRCFSVGIVRRGRRRLPRRPRRRPGGRRCRRRRSGVGKFVGVFGGA